MLLDLAGLPDPLFAVLQGYASLTTTRELPDMKTVSFEEAHDFFLNWLLLNPHFQAYPPSRQYQALFWKWAVGRLEESLASQDAEIDDRLYTHLVQLVQLVQTSSSAIVGVRPPSETYITYLWKASDIRSSSICPGIASATLLESRTLIERGTTGLKTWTASISLAEFLFRNPELVRGQRVLELGSGAGFLGITVATLQQPSLRDTHDGSALWLTDVDSNVLERCQNNIRLPCNASSYHTNVHCAEIDWADAADSSTRPALEAKLCEADADIIIGADIVFDPGIIPALVNTIELAMTRKKICFGKVVTVRAYIALTVRNEDTHSQFVTEAARRFDMQNISTELKKEGLLGMQHDQNQAVRLYRIQQRE